MNKPISLAILRQQNWAEIPKKPGVYWWYFPVADWMRFCKQYPMSALNLEAVDGKVCLYHGMANSLHQRIRWHASQDLRASAIKSGWLSTFRFTLLALNGFVYDTGIKDINNFFDRLSVKWKIAESRQAAKEMEAKNLGGKFHFPLNIQNNRAESVSEFVAHLKSVRQKYKEQTLRELP